ncbi:exostosin family protein [Hymenobacter sp. HDW8]|uniref:exostosin domain-containing protein n=1 Tax=Hymenobacter sp. HDW8 TaxID=2714932 RepID=UPI00140D2F3A|nr:exostosin family protein [Hymenobacter sp. HDW8]QIL75602.1 exostosin family protein [Hymenobacter sp. HDW8]
MKPLLLCFPDVEEVKSPTDADILLIQENNSFKNFNYITSILEDPLLCNCYHKVYTINTDDCATGLFRGLYTSLPKSRFNSNLYAAVPYLKYPNELVFLNNKQEIEPNYLASWRGNTKSNSVRSKLFRALSSIPSIHLEKTDSWLNHSFEEKQTYVELIQQAKFSLCPAGWAPVSFRIYESMALGKCPVIIADNFVPPKGPNWSDFALFFPEKHIANLYSFLLQHEESHQILGSKAQEEWNRFFSPEKINEFYTQSLHSLLVLNSASSQEAELKRWRSFNFYWSNNWTVPQRVFNKIRKLTRIN